MWRFELCHAYVGEWISCTYHKWLKESCKLKRDVRCATGEGGGWDGHCRCYVVSPRDHQLPDCRTICMGSTRIGRVG